MSADAGEILASAPNNLVVTVTSRILSRATRVSQTAAERAVADVTRRRRGAGLGVRVHRRRTGGPGGPWWVRARLGGVVTFGEDGLTSCARSS
jgi:hypothetical protein